MDINLLAVLVCGIVAMVIGFIWYGPLFGKMWEKAHGEPVSEGSKSLYFVQFVLSLLTAYVLAHFINAWQDTWGGETALWIWLGFVVPIVAGSSLWTNDSKKVAWAKFLLQAGYQFIIFVMFGIILSMWR